MENTKNTMQKKEYKKEKLHWKPKPTKELKKVLEYAKKGIALDIGAGEGRNSIFLAKNGFKVEAIDKIREGLEKCRKSAEKHNLSIQTKVCDVRKFRLEKNKYSLILAVAVLDFLKLSETQKIIEKIKKSLKKEGVFYLVVFSVKDPAFKRCERKLKMVEKNTFYLSRLKTYRHFFKKKELIGPLKNFQIIKIKEGKIKDISHGKPHFHQLISVIAKKKEV